MNPARLILCFMVTFVAGAFAQPGNGPQPSGRPSFIYGIDAHFPPFTFIKPNNGEPDGFEVELIKEVAAKMGYDLSIHLGAWKDIKAGFMRGDVDVVGMWETEERKTWAVFSSPFAAGEGAMFVHKQGKRYSGLNELAGARIAIEAEAMTEDRLRAEYPNYTYQRYPTAEQTLLAVEKQEADVAITGRATGLSVIRDQRLSNVVTCGPVMHVTNVCFCVRPGNELLLQKINAALAELQRSGRYEVIRDRWLGESAADRRVAAAERKWVTVVAWIGGVAAVVAIVAIGALAINTSLRRTIARRTAELEREMAVRRKAEETAARAKRLESLGKITGRIAHDVNNVLTAVVGTAHLLRQNPHLSEYDSKLVQGLLSAADHGSSMTRQLVAFSQGSLGRRQLVDLAAIVNGLTRSTSLKLPPHTDLSVSVVGETHLVMADYAQLEQLVFGLVRFAAGSAESTCHLVEVSLRREGDRIVLGVVAHGRWLTDEGGVDLFDPLDGSSHAGTFGLAACRAIAQSNGGDINVGTHDTRGAVLTVHLTPASAPIPDPSNTTLSPSTPAKIPAADAVRVLVIEDNDSVRELVAMQLRADGYQVAEAENGRQGLELGLATRPDIVLTDVVLPEVQGHEVVRQLRERWPQLRAIVMSGYAEHADTVSAVLRPDDRVLAKPFGLDELSQTMREVLGSLSSAGKPLG